MPVTRFRDIAQMQADLWNRDRGDPVRRLSQILKFWRRAVPRRHPRGVARFRTIEEANRAREQWLTSEVQRIQQERGR